MENALIIRPATSDELYHIITINRMVMPAFVYNDEYYQILLEDFPSLTLVALYEGEIAGYILNKIEHMTLFFTRALGRQGYIVSFGVLPKYQGKGIGLQLLNAAKAALLNAKANEFYLHTATYNETSHRLYQRAGFEKVATQKGYFTAKNNEDAFIFAQRIL